MSEKPLFYKTKGKENSPADFDAKELVSSILDDNVFQDSNSNKSTATPELTKDAEKFQDLISAFNYKRVIELESIIYKYNNSKIKNDDFEILNRIKIVENQIQQIKMYELNVGGKYSRLLLKNGLSGAGSVGFLSEFKADKYNKYKILNDINAVTDGLFSKYLLPLIVNKFKIYLVDARDRLISYLSTSFKKSSSPSDMADDIFSILGISQLLDNSESPEGVAGIKASEFNASSAPKAPQNPLGLTLPEKAPVLYSEREKDPVLGRKHTAIEFYDLHWRKYADAGVLFQDDLRKLDPSYIDGIFNFSTRHNVKNPDAKIAPTDFLPPPKSKKTELIAETGDDRDAIKAQIAMLYRKLER
ncbi:hypothetical protein OVA03_12720 [Asticcacaulis sp. SL142]|uniref:hypothetical protein n=1 Tax=Asticcacaulis sp. SL142 TaxID=2995155 RepID=UPI00226CFF8D|nr:hypothetical protein [Asticcacaulis sp. SL142]WAC47559.1 hypothetical protein OVA03_12720 [Asticcacaulis sp. SL142]